jgi:hypothetical protein
MMATDISSGGYLLAKSDPTIEQTTIYQWNQNTGCTSAPCGSFTPLPEQPMSGGADGGVAQPVVMVALGAAANPAYGALSVIDNTGAVWASW